MRHLTRILLIFAALGLHMPAQAQISPDNESRNLGDSAIIGEVTLVIGRAFLNNEADAGIDSRIHRGDFLKEGHVIRTEASGHVHIRFRDDAVMSVRPNSELHIVAYSFDQVDPTNSLIKFNLVEGTARSVSGEAAKAARERFRLNTPIAAIGVRGTDFVVSATTDSVMALVNEGAIVVAPFSEQCASAGIGPCNLNAVELDGESQQIIEFNSDMSAPQLVPVIAGGQELQQLTDFFRGAAARDQSFLESDGNEIEISPQSNDEQNAAVKEVVAESVTSLDLGASARGQAPYETSYTPGKQAVSGELKSRQLVWGRFADGKGSLERITLPLADASQGRNVTVGANFEYFLFRPESGEAQVNSGLGQVGFSLTNAQAYFKKNDSVTPVAVSGGDLVINFNSNAFKTTLDLYHMQLGEAQFNSAGRLYDGGYFHSRDGSSRIVGAVSLDGIESGYFFDFLNWDGLLQGITLWDATK